MNPSSSASSSSSLFCQRILQNRNPATKSKENGSIRLYSADGERSTVATLTLNTTSGQIAENYKVDSLYIQTGNFHIRKLPSDARPLEIFISHIRSIGFDLDLVKNFSSQEAMKNIISFYLGRPTFEGKKGIHSEILMAECEVRRGRLVHKWIRSRCILYNGGIRILRAMDEGEMIPLINKKVDLHQAKRGNCLRIQDSLSTTLLLFDDNEQLHQWLYKCQQNVQSTSSDLSDQRLTLLPEVLFNSPENFKKLNLRRNSLSSRKFEETPLFGYLDDLSRFHNLQILDLSFNDLTEFPLAITDLFLLETLNLSSNRLEFIPQEIAKMKKLFSLDLSNNRLSSLPNQLVECSSLSQLNLAFNSFKRIPLVLTRLDLVRTWLLAGNFIEKVENYDSDLEQLQKIDLRRNNLEQTFRLPVGSYEHLFHIDLRDNQKLSIVYLTNAPAIRIALCSRLQLTTIHLNGQSLTHLFVDHNLLDSLVVMPIPSKLQVLDVSHNVFETLPDWICDLQSLSAVRANHNRLISLPSRIFCMPSLRLLCALNNEISHLPNTFEDAGLETILLQNNSIQELPVDFFKALPRLRQLNVSFNELRSFPLPSFNVDWNKLQVLRAAHNNLDETVVPVIVLMKRLKILDLSNNKLRYFDDSALNTLTLLEDLNISSNLISTVSVSIPQLPALTHFRAHSNSIQSMPDLRQSLTMQVVDLSSNQIALFSPSMASTPALRSLDVSCNPLLQIDSGTISRSRKKPVAVVDVGQTTNKLSFGFSETTGNRNRLCIRRISKKGSVFGLIDGGSNYELPKAIFNMINEQLDDMIEIDLKKIIVSTHFQLGEIGSQLGANVLLTHVKEDSLLLVASGTIGIAVLTKTNIVQLDTGSSLEEEDYLKLRKNSLWLDENNLINGITNCPRQLGMYHLHPAVSPNPIFIEGSTEGIDTIVIASKALWEHLSSPDISKIINSTVNPQVAAKRLQDALQSCDYMGNSSILAIKLPKTEIKFESPHSSLKNLEESLPLKGSRSTENVRGKTSEVLESLTKRIERKDEELTGKQLYDKILAEEYNQLSLSSPNSSSGAPPPDPKSQEEEEEIPPDLPPTPTPRVLPPTYSDFKESQKYSLGFATTSEGQYNVSEHARRFDSRVQREEKTGDEEPKRFPFHSKNIKEFSNNPPPVNTRSLSIIKEISESRSSELAIDEPHTFSYSSGPTTVLTPMEESLSSRYRFEYARSNLQENLKLSHSSTMDL